MRLAREDDGFRGNARIAWPEMGRISYGSKGRNMAARQETPTVRQEKEFPTEWTMADDVADPRAREPMREPDTAMKQQVGLRMPRKIVAKAGA